MAMAKSFKDFRGMTDDALIALYDNIATSTSVGLRFIAEELARRERARASEELQSEIGRRLQGLHQRTESFFSDLDAELIRRRQNELTLSPAARSWMVFVDGENLAIRGRSFLERHGVVLPQSVPSYVPGSYLWFPARHPREFFFPESHLILRPRAVRAHIYTMVSGGTEAAPLARKQLTELGFHAEVFSKPKSRRAKGVDISLARDLLLHGFQGNYDVAILVSGDGDFAPLVREVKRFGRSVCLAFPGEDGLNPDLRQECDEYFNIGPELVLDWRDFCASGSPDEPDDSVSFSPTSSTVHPDRHPE